MKLGFKPQTTAESWGWGGRLERDTVRGRVVGGIRTQKGASSEC